MAAVCALALAVPGQSATAKYVNDLFIFLDGAHRVVSGQVPNRDFHTVLGPLVYYIPALGLLIAGSLGAAMPIGMALLIAAVAPVLAYVLASRLRPGVALPFAAFLLLILTVPINLGEGFISLSFGMFYNRIGWVLLAILLVMYLPPRLATRWRTALDAACAAFLVAILAYMKASYGAVALAYLGFLLVVSRDRAWPALALALAAAVALVVELFWRSSFAYVGDLLLADKVSGGLSGGLDGPEVSFLRNLADYVVAAAFAAIALWRRRSLRDVLFYGFCGLAGFLLIRQNFQTWGIVTLFAGAAVATELVGRDVDTSLPGVRRWPGRGAELMLVAFLLPSIAHCAIALGLHVAAASVRPVATFALPKFDRIRLVDFGTHWDFGFFTTYGRTLEDGERALARLGPNPGPVFVLDFVNPFTAGLGLTPARGDSPWHHFERTFDKQHFIPAESLLADVRVVMQPKVSVEEGTAQALREIYAPYLEAHFEFAEETEFWRILRLKRPEGVASATPER
jgi:hypothetical protein